MRIKTKLQIVAALVIAITCILGVSFFWTFQISNREGAKEAVADAISGGMLELQLLTFEYVQDSKDRTAQQWHAQRDAITDLVHSSYNRFENPKQKELLDTLLRDMDGLSRIFLQIVDNESQGGSAKREETHAVLDRRLRNQMFARMQSVSSIGPQLCEISRRRSMLVHQYVGLAVIILTLLMAGAAGVALYLTYRGIAPPLEALYRGAEIIGGGNLRHRVGTDAKDEIGQLSREFDRMVGRILEVTSSRDELNREVEERQQAEAKLRWNEERLEALLELGLMRFGAEDALIDYALEGAVRLTRSSVGYLHFFCEDEQTMSLYQWSKEVLKECTAVKTPHYPLDMAGVWADCIRLREPVIHNDYPNLPGKKGYPAGHFPLLRHLSVPIFDGGKIVAVIGVGNKETPYDDADVRQLTLYMTSMWEILKRTQAEAKLETTAAELERSNRELQQFAYIASHDLQEPLRKITAFGDRLVMRAAGALDEKSRDYLARMQSAAGRMKQLIEDLLDYSRVTTQAQPFAPVNLGALLGETLETLEYRLAESGGRVEIVGILPTVPGDRSQLQQLFQNLLANALKYHQPDLPPQVLVSGRELADGQAEITIADNGIGFDEKYLDRIFLPFQRLHTREEYSGTGIGLAICQKIVQRHGGTLTATSRPGEGSSFVVTLPLSVG